MSILAKIKKVSYDLMESVVRNIGGGIGERIRYRLYKSRFKSCGVNVKFGIGVKIVGPEYISIGDNVWIDDYCILIAGTAATSSERIIRRIKNKNYGDNEGILMLGSNIHISIGCIVNSFGGGIVIGDYCGLSSGVKIYSMSNHFMDHKDDTVITYCNPMVKALPVPKFIYPIVLGRNCFVTLNSTILGGTIGENSYVGPYSLVVGNFPDNSYIAGNPAKKLKNRFDRR